MTVAANFVLVVWVYVGFILRGIDRDFVVWFPPLILACDAIRDALACYRAQKKLFCTIACRHESTASPLRTLKRNQAFLFYVRYSMNQALIIFMFAIRGLRYSYFLCLRLQESSFRIIYVPD